MICINSIKQYESKLISNNNIYCLLFSKTNSSPCLVMERQLSITCKKYSIELFKIDCTSQKLYPIINKYNVGIMPKYLFIKKDIILYEEIGTEVEFIIEKHINKWGIII